MKTHVVLAIVLVVAACKKAEQKPSEPPREPAKTTDAAPAVQPPDASGLVACDTLSRAKCLASDHCTLDLVGQNVYRCRPDRGPCEVGMKQGDKRACEAKAECAFDSGTCYCPCEGAARTETVDEPGTGCACACGGGAPASCVEKATTEQECAKMTRKQCLESRNCTLHLVGNRVYECKADSGPCEVGIQQTDRKVCEAQPGCAWKAGEGYCPCPGAGKTAVDDEQSGPQGCACGGTGGPPPMCVAN